MHCGSIDRLCVQLKLPITRQCWKFPEWCDKAVGMIVVAAVVVVVVVVVAVVVVVWVGGGVDWWGY